MKVAGFHHKNLATLFCSNMHFGCRIFWWMLPTFIKKYVRCWQGCCHVVFLLMDVGHLHQKKYAKCWQGCCHRPFFLMNAGHFHQKKLWYLKDGILMCICLCSSLDPSFFWWWFNYRISHRDFQWEHGFHVFLCSMFFLALPGCSVQALWDSGPNL